MALTIMPEPLDAVTVSSLPAATDATGNSLSASFLVKVVDTIAAAITLVGGPVNNELTTTGGTSLRYDTTAGQFIQNWQTPK